MSLELHPYIQLHNKKHLMHSKKYLIQDITSSKCLKINIDI
jgi:hypothetical protein